MLKSKLNTIVNCVLLLSSLNAAAAEHPKYRNPFYLGATIGYGTSTWNGIVPPGNKQNIGTRTSVPLEADEGGVAAGIAAGYEFSPNFALEGTYFRYPNAKITYDDSSVFYTDHNILVLHSGSANFSLMAKIMIFIPNTEVRAYTSAGLGWTHRWDYLRDRRRGTPSFGFGFNYDITPDVMWEGGFIYSAGYGQSELDPADDYMPFLYSGFMRLAYKFNI